MDKDLFLKPEDYEEPACLLCMDDSAVSRIDAKRFIEKLDGYYSRNDYDGAEHHLRYWLAEAAANGDKRGEFTVYNEMMGYFRKTGKREEALSSAKNALDLIAPLGLQGSVSAGTAYVNVATVYKTFNESDKALPWFEKAMTVYEASLSEDDTRLGGLYNNMALSLSDLCRYDEAISYFGRAIGIMMKAENGELEAAISYLNMANTRESQLGLEGAEEYISEYCERAYELLETPSLPRNGYYAFVCEKCAPTLRYYGYFLYASKLEESARIIYERS